MLYNIMEMFVEYCILELLEYTITKGMYFSVKKSLAILLTALLLVSIFGGCKPREDTLAESGAPASESSQSITDEERAAQNNQQIKDVNLIQFKDPAPGSEIAVMKTSMGEVRIMLFREQAPKTVENFVVHSKEGFYNGLTFHRVIDGFMIQGGDPEGTGMGGYSIYKDAEGKPTGFEDEFTTDLWNFRGALSMANTGQPMSNGSQFFIVQSPEIVLNDPQDPARVLTKDEKLAMLKQATFPESVIEKYSENGGTPGLDMRHTVFGMVIDGMDIVDQIAKVETNESDKPIEPVIIESITIETAK